MHHALSLVPDLGLVLGPALALALASPASAQIVLEPPTSLTLAHRTQGVISGDVDGDGHADLISLPRFEQGFVQPKLSVLLGDGDGGFGAPIVTTLPTTDCNRGCAAFIDDDAVLDLALGFTTGGANGITLLYGAGDGTFQPGPSWTLPGGFVGNNVADVLPADLTGDGLLDFVIVEAGSIGLIPGRISTLVANFEGYTLMVGVALQIGTTHAAVGDVTSDGHPDVLASNSAWGTLSLLAGLGDGSFAPPVSLLVGGRPRGLVLADLDGDGALDLALADETGNRVLVQAGDGAGHFTTLQSVPVGAGPVWLSAGPLDADAELDLLVSNGGSGELTALRGNGDGTFAAVATVSHVPSAGSSTLADFDEDGVLDAAVGTLTIPGTLAVLRNHSYAAGSPFADLGQAFPGTQGYPILLADGTLQPATPVSFRLLNALPGGKATLFVGFTEANLPFKGGTLVPFPNLTYPLLPLTGAGTLTLSAGWPGGVPAGFAIALQFWFKDPGAANLYAGSNAVRAVAP